MENIDIYSELKIISTEISAHTNEFISRIDAYLSGFGNDSLFSFSDDKKRNKLYKENYYSFVASLSEISESLNTAISRLSILLERADNELELEIIVLIGSKLDAFFYFETLLGEFSKATKKLLAAESISASQLIFESRKLRSAAETLALKFSE